MRTFLIRAHDIPTEFGFTLDNLPGNGRADLVSRAVGSALLTSHGIREDAVVIVSARGHAVKFEGGRMGGLNPDERSIAGVLQSAFQTYSDEWKGSTPGVEAARKDFEQVLEEVGGSRIKLSSSGVAAKEVEIPGEPVFLLSDHRDFTAEEQEAMEGCMEVSLSPIELHTDQAVTLANMWLDTSGFTEF